MAGMAGGLTHARLPNDEVVAITALMKHVYSAEQGGDPPAIFKPIMYRTQVVAGIHYFIKVQVDEAVERSCVHLKVLQEPVAKKVVLSLSATEKDKKLDDPIEKF